MLIIFLSTLKIPAYLIYVVIEYLESFQDTDTYFSPKIMQYRYMSTSLYTVHMCLCRNSVIYLSWNLMILQMHYNGCVLCVFVCIMQYQTICRHLTFLPGNSSVQQQDVNLHFKSSVIVYIVPLPRVYSDFPTK